MLTENFCKSGDKGIVGVRPRTNDFGAEITELLSPAS